MGVVVVAGVWGAAAALALADAKRHTDAGLDRLRSAQAGLEAADLLRGEGRDELRAAQHEFAVAHGRVDGPVVAPLRWLPFVGRQVRSVDSLTAAAEEVVDVGIRALDDTSAVIDATDPEGPARITLARRLGAIANSASVDLDAVDLGPEEHLVGALQRAHDRFADELDDLRRAVHDLEAAGNGFGAFLEGPSRYLVLAANNSEMRMGSGAFLSAGVLTVEHGSFDLGDMESTEAIEIPAGSVPIDDVDFAQRWGFAEPTDDLRELAMSPRFDIVGPLALDMWAAAKGERLDGVLVIDPIALRSLLEVTGPVVVDDEEFSADNVVGEIFLEQYRDLEYDPRDSEQLARRDRLSRIARAAIEALEDGGWDALDLIEALRPAVGGRHVLAYSTDPLQQAGWAGAGIDGRVEPDELMVALHNRAGNKLDQFVSIDAELVVQPSPGADTGFEIRMQLRNDTPEGLPRYVAGPYPGTPRAADGKYQGWIVVELPRFARHNSIDVAGEPVLTVAAGADGPDHRVVAALVEFERGETVEVVVHFDLPAGERSLRIAPGARVPAVRWTFGSQEFRDEGGRRLEWTDTGPE